MLLHKWKFVAVLAMLALSRGDLTAQATATQDTAAKAKPAEKVKRGGANFITESEISSVAEENAWDIIQRLRPSMTRMRGGFGNGAGEGGGIVVYVDDARYGAVESLRNVQRATIKEIRYLSGPDATQRYGTGVPSGVIQIVTKH